MQTTVPMKTATLNVPGASIYYEVRGAGPALLMMPGGPADAGAFRNIAGPLAAHYTVVTYDGVVLNLDAEFASRTAPSRAPSMTPGSCRSSPMTRTGCWRR